MPTGPSSAITFVEGLLERFEVPHVHLAGDDPPPGVLDLLDRLLQVLGRGHGVANDLHLLTDVDGNDVRPFLGQAYGVAAALAPGRPGDEGDLAIELSHPSFPLFPSYSSPTSVSVVCNPEIPSDRLLTSSAYEVV